jgi:CheY-like chemotaxis protein
MYSNAALRDPAHAPRSDRPRVLVVDDLPVLRKSIVDLLERDGMTVVAEAEGQEAAIAAIEEADPDVVLLDLRTRQVNTLDLVRHIRGLELTVMVVGLVGANDSTAPTDARAAGLFALVKGSGPWELLSAVEQAHASLYDDRA